MSNHTDPDFYAKYEFCRVECEECDRLDRIDGPVSTTELMEALAKVEQAIENGEEPWPHDS